MRLHVDERQNNRMGPSADCRKRAPTLARSLSIQETNSLEAKRRLQ